MISGVFDLRNKSGGRACGQTIGADGSGEFGWLSTALPMLLNSGQRPSARSRHPVFGWAALFSLLQLIATWGRPSRLCNLTPDSPAANRPREMTCYAAL